jgi:hypothetical protein
VSVPKIICDRKTRDKLGEDGLTEVRAQLYAVDCQTCGRPLGTDAPALVVNAVDDWAMAGLHHRGCRSAEWNDGVIEFSAGATITWSAESILFPVPTASGGRARCAMLIVNPSLEVLYLYPGAAGWRPGYHAAFNGAGLAPSSGPALVLRDRIAPGVTARIRDAEIAAVFRQPAPEGEYSAAAAPETVAAARAHGFLFVVTHALDPSGLGSMGLHAALQQVLDAIEHERAITGWAAPDGP